MRGLTFEAYDYDGYLEDGMVTLAVYDGHPIPGTEIGTLYVKSDGSMTYQGTGDISPATAPDHITGGNLVAISREIEFFKNNPE